MAFSTISRPTTSYQNISKPTTTYVPVNELGISILSEDLAELLSEDGFRLIMEEQFPTIYTAIPKPA